MAFKGQPYLNDFLKYIYKAEVKKKVFKCFKF